MKANKKIRGNRYRLDSDEVKLSRIGFVGILDVVIKVVLTAVVVCLSSLVFIAAHDVAVQSDYFAIRDLPVTGARSLSREEILETAGVKTGDNLLAVNLFVLKKKLKSHPWIQDVSVKRQFPSTLSIVLKEEVALAVIRMENGDVLLLNTLGDPFKELDTVNDIQAEMLPVVTGLSLVATEKGYGFKSRLFDSVMALLELNREGLFREIDADADTGLTLTRSISPARVRETLVLKLGFDGYREKLAREKQILAYMDTRPESVRACVIDLFDLKNVTAKVKPILPVNSGS